MTTVGKFFAELGFKVNLQQLKNADNAMKSISKSYQAIGKGIQAETKALRAKLIEEKINTQLQKTKIQQAKAEEAITKASTAEIRKKTAEINLENKQYKQRQTNFQEYVKSVRNGLLVLAGLTWGFNRFTRSTREAALTYRDFRAQTGMSTQTLQQYQAAGAMTGSRLTPDQVAKDITELQQRAQDIQYGKGNIRPYQMLGITPNQSNAYNVIEALRKKIKGLSDEASLYWIRQMGLGDDWIHILRQSREEFEAIRQVMLSEKQIDRVSDMAMSWRKLEFALKQAKDQFVAFISPYATNTANNFTEMTRDIGEFIKSINESNGAFKALAVTLSGLLVYLSPSGALIAGLALLTEDLYVASKGGESFFDWSPEIKESIRAIKDLKKNLDEIEEYKNRNKNPNEKTFWGGVWAGLKGSLDVFTMPFYAADALGQGIGNLQNGLWWDRVSNSITTGYNAGGLQGINNAMKGIPKLSPIMKALNLSYLPESFHQPKIFGPEGNMDRLLSSGLFLPQTTNNNVTIQVSTPEEAARVTQELGTNSSNEMLRTQYSMGGAY